MFLTQLGLSCKLIKPEAMPGVIFKVEPKKLLAASRYFSFLSTQGVVVYVAAKQSH